MEDLFKSLEDPEFFEAYVGDHFSNAPSLVIQDFPCRNVIDIDRVRLAYGYYKQSIDRYSVLLESTNPDHYKRSGALLHALYKSEIVKEVEFLTNEYGSVDSVEFDHVLGVDYFHAQKMVQLPRFYELYYNSMLSFDLAYKSCWAYEDTPVLYDINYLHNVCHYLHTNDNLNVDSCSMVLRSLMHGGR